MKRSNLPALYKRFSPALVQELEKLRFAPILINSDPRDSSKTLTEIRQGERGDGDHALTIFDTGRTFFFDQSHIFFDGGWGAALAEIMTNEALSWAGYLNMLDPSVLAKQPGHVELDPAMQPGDHQLIEQVSRVSPEAGAENNRINIKACIEFRKFFKQRSDNVELTINNLLVAGPEAVTPLPGLTITRTNLPPTQTTQTVTITSTMAAFATPTESPTQTLTPTLIPTVTIVTGSPTPAQIVATDGYPMTVYYHEICSFYMLNKGRASRSVSGFVFERVNDDGTFQDRFEGWNLMCCSGCPMTPAANSEYYGSIRKSPVARSMPGLAIFLSPDLY